MVVNERIMDVLGYEQLTGLSSAKGLTNVPNGTTMIWMQAEAQQIRVRWDSTDPTASVGQPLLVGGAGVKLAIDTPTIRKARFIESVASAKLNVTYFGPKDSV